ncbi:MAG: HlyD family efflux transporter periplasmic adaptor subunit [Planctomycetaceae bacterium]|nr:HlyD family efflux transporter periplasmic adaptor subunit [Planctomycetaceae bacterium]
MGTTRRSKQTIILAAGLLCLLLVGVAFLKYSGKNGDTAEQGLSTYSVKKGDLVMSVAEGGTIKARNSVDIKSQVEGETTIVSIVPEGTYLSREDVDNRRVILELDASELTDRVNQQEIDFNSAEADFTEARESLDIQINQNDSDIQAGLMTVKFGLMDLKKYLGETTALKAVRKYDPNEQSKFDVTALINDPNQLGGESLQKLRDLGSEITLAEQELKRAQIDLDWTRKLYAKQYESRSELETAQLNSDRLKVRWDQAKTALDLFIRYEFPKEAERLFSEFLEAERQLQRVHAQARSKLAQAQAKVKSTEARYTLSKERLGKLTQQLAACTVRATVPGLVIYASGSRGRFGGSRSYIEVGQQIRERETIMTITNAEEKDVDVKVHETNVDKIRIGQPVRIVVDAQPDKIFLGNVKKIAPLPDQASFFGNPDLKVYTTEVSIENVDPQIKPGMSARVEILVAELRDVLSIPVQSVANRDGRKVCFLVSGGSSREIPIQTGAFNDRFIQVLDGLSEGQQVLLNPPRLLGDIRAASERPMTAKADMADSDQAAAEPEEAVNEQPPQQPETVAQDGASGRPDFDRAMQRRQAGGMESPGDRPMRMEGQMRRPRGEGREGRMRSSEDAGAAVPTRQSQGQGDNS